MQASERLPEDREREEAVYEWALRLVSTVADLRHALDHERQLHQESIESQLREIERLRKELRAEGLSERIVLCPGITCGGYGRTYRYVRDRTPQDAPKTAAGGDQHAPVATVASTAAPS